MNDKAVAAESNISPKELASELTGDQADEGDSPKGQSRTSSKPRSNFGFWQRLKRALFGPEDGETLREDLSEALKNGDDLVSGFSPDERAMLDNILLMREVRVEDVMVPRADVEAVDASITLGELLTVFEASGHSRMPVFNENLDDPKGMVHIKDLVAYLTKSARNGRRSSSKTSNGKTAAKPLDFTRVKLDKTLQSSGIMRKVLFIPESMLAADLLKRMQATRTQMALVIDEYGGTDGLVSLEDVVEIVVGDIEDEHDDDDGPLINEMSSGVWQADAKAGLDDLSVILKSDFSKDEDAEDADTLGGLIFARLGRVPVRGEVVRMIQGFEFHVTDADARRIKSVRIVRLRTGTRRRANKSAPQPSSTNQD